MDGWAWWGGRRWAVFSLATAMGFSVATVAYELATPWWAGDHIGLSSGACAFYGLVGLMWVAALNLVYGLVWMSEKLVGQALPPGYRRRAFALVVAGGAASWPAWLTSVVVASWLRRP